MEPGENKLLITEEKIKLRTEIKKVLKTLTPQQIHDMSLGVLNNLQKLDAWNNADSVLAFLPMKSEVDTSFFITTAILEGKKVALPRIAGSDIFFHFIDPVSETDLVMHEYGMLEPPASAPRVTEKYLKKNRILILTPGLAFDKNCTRLGRGKSFYDRFLAGCGKNCLKAGLAFDLQISERVPFEMHDVKLDFVITEKRVISGL